MLLKGKYKNILLIFLFLLVLIYSIFIYQEYKYSILLEDLEIEHIIGQHLMIAPENKKMTDAYKELITKYNIGNIKIYGYNYKNKKQLNELIVQSQNLSLQYNKGIPLFVATDQEGGWVAHLRKGFTIPPAHYAIGLKNNRSYAYWSGYIIASELSLVGINMNFAPVVDLALNDENWVIGPRSFGKNKKIAVEMASEFIKAHLRRSVLPVIKHYPGIGRMMNDPHVSLITNKADYTVLKNMDLYPFNELLRTSENGVMIANAYAPSIVQFMEQVDRTDYKLFYNELASMSEIILKRYLIEYKGFQGLIISDEMNVPPVNRLASRERIVYQSLKAGIDIVLVNHSPDRIIKIVQYLKKMYKKDRMFRKQMKRSLKKILQNKAYIFKNRNKISYLSPDLFKIEKFKKSEELHKINSDAFKKLNHKLSYNIIDIIQDRKNQIPLSQSRNLRKEKFVVITSKKDLYHEFKKYINFQNMKLIKMKSYITGRITSEEIQNIKNQITENSILIVSVMSRSHNRLIKELYKKNKNIIVINLLHPSYIRDLNMIDLILATYSDNLPQLKMVVKKLIQQDSDNYFDDIIKDDQYY